MSLEFNQLVESNYGRVRYIASNYTYSEDVDDLIQEIFLQVWRSFASFRGDAKVETWIYRIALNTAITYRQKHIKHHKVQNDPDGELTEKSEIQGLNEAQILAAFASSLNKIDRAVLLMYMNGLSALEMESVLDVKANAIKVRISRLKEKFRQKYVG